MKSALPTLEAVRKCLASLLASPPQARKAPPFVPGPKTPAVVSLFATDDGTVTVAWISDIGFAASAGAALTMIPDSQVDACVTRGGLEGMVYENYQEIMNIVASLFNGPGAAHTKLVSVQHVPKQPLPEAGAALLKKSEGRLDLEIEIPRYRAGRVSVLVI
jgi:hypothetical protein